MSGDLHEHLKFFGALGITGVSRDPAWRRRAEPDTLPDASVPPAAGAPSPFETLATPSLSSSGTPAERLAALKVEIGPDCQRCKLCDLGRRQVVFGVGHPRARLMFVGEAPGEEEDRQGEPFVGRAGQLLTKIVEAINLTREQIYIANVIKCRPPGNRNPEPDEVAACEPFLLNQIETIGPRVIVALGKFAAQCLLRSTEPITRLRGREFDYRGATLIPTFHPAYLLRNPPAKRDVWEDMKRVRAILVADSRAPQPPA
ncbi:MAG TPA: uracil-DNA glycosylase [Vicinamibacterales bacterium]|nr:uracil-DNA glycosylase [Vicinamibacterales bacterium]